MRQMLTRTIYLSLDPYQWMRRRNGVEQPGDVCHGRTVSQVVSGNIPEYQPGDFVFYTNGLGKMILGGSYVAAFGASVMLQGYFDTTPFILFSVAQGISCIVIDIGCRILLPDGEWWREDWLATLAKMVSRVL